MKMGTYLTAAALMFICGGFALITSKVVPLARFQGISGAVCLIIGLAVFGLVGLVIGGGKKK